MEEAAAAAQDALPLLDAPAAFLHSLVRRLGPEDAAALACACRAAAALVDDPALWHSLLLARYGRGAVPRPRPTEPCRALQLPGWTFFPGLTLDCGDDDDDADASRPGPTGEPQALAAAAAGGDGPFAAFCNVGGAGRLFREAPGRAGCRRASYKPSEGLYVRTALAEAEGLPAAELLPPAPPPPAPQPGAAAASPSAAPPRRSRRLLRQEEGDGAAGGDDGLWPPQRVPGWTYFPWCQSSDHTAQAPAANMAAHASLEDLLEHAATRPDVVAVTPAGETKHKLRPQACWRAHPDWGVGLYVKDSVAAAMRLTPPPGPVPDYRALAAKLGRLQLDMRDADVVWLNDTYLTLVPTDGPPPPGNDGAMLRLNYVWWLDWAGRIPGVPPGDYEVLFCVRFPRGANHLSGLVFNIDARADPTRAAADEQQQPDAAPPGGGGLAVQLPMAAVIQQWQQQGWASWFDLRAGVLRVAELSAVTLHFYDHASGREKHGIDWSHARLRRVGAGDPRAARRPAPARPSLAQGLLAAAENCRVA